MLIRSHDGAIDDQEWKDFLLQQNFGQLIASGRDRPVPVVVPTHFSFDGVSRVVLHLARDNPVFQALEENPAGLLSVIGAYAYIPSYWNEPEPYGVPTSYYAAVQVSGECRVSDAPADLEQILLTQLNDLQPEGKQDPALDRDDPTYIRLMRAIRGIEMDVREVRAKFKFGGNKPRERREAIASRLQERDQGLDRQARAHLLRRSGSCG